MRVLLIVAPFVSSLAALAKFAMWLAGRRAARRGRAEA